MVLDLDPDALNARVDALRTGFAGWNNALLTRNQEYLRAYSPAFDATLKEHDQWNQRITSEDADHFRSSYNLTRAVVELWASLEMSEFPAIRWWQQYLPTPTPDMDPQITEARQESYRAAQLVARKMSTMREQILVGHIRRAKLERHAYNAVVKKNVYGHAWLKTIPDRASRTFRVWSDFDTSTVFPVWSSFDQERLDAILVGNRRSAAQVNAEFPGFVTMSSDGLTLDASVGYYNPTNDVTLDAGRHFVWVEDYWCSDGDWQGIEPSDDDQPIVGRVVNVRRVNGKIAKVIEYPGWTDIPFVRFENPNGRDHLGFSDVGTMLPIQDSLNRFMSQQQDVIAGESRPKFVFRGESDKQITFNDESVVSIDSDEDLSQLQVHLDVFPTQVHGQQLLEVLARATGLPDAVWGRISAAQNSGRALATAWRSAAARMVPRTNANAAALGRTLSMWADWMELYDWDSARDLYNGNRDFELDFPNQEPRDFSEVTLDAVNKLNAGIIDVVTAMEKTGERSPDEMLDKVRADYMDPVMHPEKSQSYLLLQRLKNQIAIEAQQAGLQAAAAQQQLQQMASAPPGGAPGGTTDQQAGAAQQANVQAQQQAAPANPSGQPAPTTQPGQQGNSTKFSTLVQDGSSFNRIVDQGTIA